MTAGFIGAAAARWRRLATERRVYIRSDHKTRYRAFSPASQVAIAAVTALTLGWTGYATYSIVAAAVDARRAEARFETMKDAYEARIAAIQGVQAALERQLAEARDHGSQVAKRFSDKQARLIEAKNALRDARVEAEGLRQEFSRMLDERRAATDRIHDLSSEVDRLKLELAETEAAGQGLASSIETVSDAMRDVIAQRDMATTQADSLHEAVGKLQAKVNYWEGRQERLLSQLETAAQISLDGLDKIFAKAKIDVDKILERTRRDYSGEGGPFLPMDDQPELTLEADQRVAALMNDLERVNLMRFAARKIPFGSPVRGGRYTSGFGPRRDPFRGRTSMHDGQDIAAPRGTPIYATAEGVVTTSGRMHGYGLVVKIRHAFGFETVYAHLNRSKVKVGQRVERGDLIAEMGSTGRSTGPHLHYEVRIDRQAVNPLKFIKAGRDVL